MSRSQERDGLLRGCPTCGTKVDDAHLGLRDFRWVNEYLPGRLGMMDIDGCLTQAKTGRVLMMELKPKGAFISTGARLTFQLFVQRGFDVWIVWDQGDGMVERAKVDKAGTLRRTERMSRNRLARMVQDWWNQGLEEAA